MKEELLKGLNKEQLAKIKQCKTHNELLTLAKEEGIELTDEQLEAVNGGACAPDGNINDPKKCPNCHQSNTKYTGRHDMGRIVWDSYECLNCGQEYRVVISQY